MFQWQTLKLFLSSTFKDIELQRDELSKIFGRIKDRLRDRQLFFSPYDLRFRHRHHEADIVRWCMEMVDQCQYFICILGYRYGWRPTHLADGSPNVKALSITDMEIEEALSKVEKHRRIFLFGDLGQYDDGTLQGEEETDRKGVADIKAFLGGQKIGCSESDFGSLKKLQAELRDRGETIYSFSNTTELLSIIEKKLGDVLDSDYPPGTKAPLIEHTRREALAEILAEKRKGFVGRSPYLEQLGNFASSREEKNFLTVYALAGTGKSALLAEFLGDLSTPWICHYMSQGLDSRTITGVMQSLGEQLHEKGIIEGELELDPVDLRSQVRRALEQSRNPLVVAIDGLDEMDEGGKSLSWLPKFLPPHVRVILTVRPVEPFSELQKFPQMKLLELPPLDKAEILQIIEDYQNLNQLRLSAGDRDLLYCLGIGEL